MMKTALTFALLAISIAVLGASTWGGPIWTTAARVMFCLLCLLGVTAASIREVLLFIAAAICSILLLAHGDQATLFAGLDLAAYFAAFILLLTALKIAADRSRSVLALGQFLIRQPAGRRFFATASGGHVLGVFLNFGAISLMAPLIQNATKHADGSTDTALERRQMSALLRGFAWILLWAPTTLTQAVLLTLFTEINLWKVISLGIATSALMMLLGYLYDRFEWRGYQQASDTPAPALPKAALFITATVCVTLIGTTAAIQLRFGTTTALALMFVAPVITFIWFILQRPTAISYAAQLARLGPELQKNAPALARSAIALGLSGFIGRVLADILPVAQLAEAVDLGSVPGWAFLAVLPILITLGGQIALSPIVLVVFIGQVVQAFPVLPADPTNIVFALSAGWAISMFASPNATATLLISATSNIPPTTLTWRWNLRYGLLSYFVLVVIFVLLEL